MVNIAPSILVANEKGEMKLVLVREITTISPRPREISPWEMAVKL